METTVAKNKRKSSLLSGGSESRDRRRSKAFRMSTDDCAAINQCNKEIEPHHHQNHHQTTTQQQQQQQQQPPPTAAAEAPVEKPIQKTAPPTTITEVQSTPTEKPAQASTSSVPVDTPFQAPPIKPKSIFKSKQALQQPQVFQQTSSKSPSIPATNTKTDTPAPAPSLVAKPAQQPQTSSTVRAQEGVNSYLSDICEAAVAKDTQSNAKKVLKEKPPMPGGTRLLPPKPPTSRPVSHILYICYEILKKSSFNEHFYE